MEETKELASTQSIKVEDMANHNTSSSKRSAVNGVIRNGGLTDDKEISRLGNSAVELSVVDSNHNNAELFEEKSDTVAVEAEELGDNGAGSRQSSNSNGLGIASGNNYLRNAILDEVLSEKKMALLWSPQVIKFLQDQQMAKRSNF